MDVHNKTSIAYTEISTPPKSCCNPRSQVISLLALGILSGAIAIYAANFLVALPLTIVTLTIGSGVVSLVSFIAAGYLGLCGKEEGPPSHSGLADSNRLVSNEPSAPPSYKMRTDYAVSLNIEEEPVIASVHIETTEEVIIRLKSGGFPFTSYSREYITKVKQDLVAMGQEDVLFQVALKDPSMGTTRFKELGLYEESRKAEIIEAQIQHLASSPQDFFSFCARNQGASLDDPRIKDAFCKLPYKAILLNDSTALLPRSFMGAFTSHVNAKVYDMSFSQLLQFHRTPEVLRFLTTKNITKCRADFLEAISARAMKLLTQTVKEFIADPSASFRGGMWLLERDPKIVNVLIGLGAAVEQKHHRMLLKTFGLEALSQEFTEICEGHAALTKDFQVELQSLEARFTREENHLREFSQSGERQMRLSTQDQIERAQFSFEEKSAVIKFREAERTLKQIEDLLKTTSNELQTTQAQIKSVRSNMTTTEAKLQKLTASKDSRETRIEEQRAIITRETALKKENKKATVGFATSFRVLISASPEDEKIAKAEKAIVDIENEEAQMAALTLQLERLSQEARTLSEKSTQLINKKEQLQLEKLSAITRKQDLEPGYIFEQSALDPVVATINLKLTRAIDSQKQALDKDLRDLAEKKKNFIHSAKADNTRAFERGVYHQLNTVFIPKYNALFTS